MLKQLSIFLLLAAAAQATPVTTVAWTSPISYNLPWVPVSDDATPEWAKLPNAQQWYEISSGIETNNATGILLILRALQYFGDSSTYLWLDMITLSEFGNPNSDANAPEPETFALITVGLIAIWITQRPRPATRGRSASRTHVACGDAGHRRSSLT